MRTDGSNFARKENVFKLNDTLPVEVSNTLVPFTFLPKYKDSRTDQTSAKYLPFETLNWCRHTKGMKSINMYNLTLELPKENNEDVI